MGELVGLLVLLGVAAVLLVLGLAAVIAREARRPPRHTAGYALGRGWAIDPADAGLSCESWLLSRPGGVTLPVWEIEGEGRGPTAVLVHGWGQSRLDMLRRIEPWRPLARRLVLYDLRGHGDASGGLSDLGHREEEDLLALLVQLGPGPFLLVGFSMGAVVALAAATGAAPPASDIAGVVAYGPFGRFHDSLRGRLRRSGLPARPMTDFAMAWFRLCGLRPASAEPLMSRVRVPVLVVQGTDDLVCTPELTRRLVEAAPEAALLEIEGAGHLDAHEIDPDRHDAAIRDFVTRLRPGR